MNKINRCPKCKGTIHRIGIYKDGSEYTCERCDWTGIIREKQSNRYERKIKEIEVNSNED